MQHKCIKLTNPIWTFLLSPPARGRELKLDIASNFVSAAMSPPARGRELKYIKGIAGQNLADVAPRAGAGIEICKTSG